MLVNQINFLIGSSLLFIIAFACTKALKRDLSSSTRYIIWLLFLLTIPLMTFSLNFGNRISIFDAPDRMVSPGYEYSNADRKASPADEIIGTDVSNIPESGKDSSRELPSSLILQIIRSALTFLLLGRLIYSLSISSKMNRMAKRFKEMDLTAGDRRIAVPLYICNEIKMPGVYGIFKPRILLPREAGSWDEEELLFVCLHEYGHIAGRHVLVNLIASVLRAFYWFLPFTWIAYEKMRLEQENLSDEIILRAGHDQLSYAEYLLSLIKKSPDESLRLTPIPSIIFKSQIKTRIKRIVEYNSLTGRNGRTWLSISFILFLCSLVAVTSVQCFSIESSREDEIIEFEDDNLKRAILGRSVFLWTQTNNFRVDTNKDYEISIGEASAVRHLNLEGMNIASLRGLEHFTNLETLEIGQNPYTDLTPISGLTNLRDLDLWDQHIKDITILKNLVNLRGLELEGNSLTDISVIANFDKLIYLSLFANQVVDITPIEKLTTLKYLYLDYNDVEDFSPISKLRNLEKLMINNNPCTDLEPLRHLIKLKELTVSEKQLLDADVLGDLPALEDFSVWDNDSIDYSYIEENY